MNRIFFIVIYFLILQNFLLNSVLADSGFSSDFIEQAKKLGINIGQNLDQKVSDNDLSNTSNSQSIPDLKLPSLPKTEEKADLKLPSPPKPEEKADLKLPSPPKPEEKADLKLPSPPKPEEKADLKLPSLPKPEEKPDVKLPSPPKPEEKADLKLPSLPKPEEKADLKLPSLPKPEEKADLKLPSLPKPEEKADLKLPSLPKPEEKADLKLPSPPKPEEKADLKLPSPPKPEEKADLKLPSPPKPEEKPDVKIDVKADKIEDKKMLNNKKQELKQKVSKKLSNIMDKKNITEVVKKPKILPAKIIPKQKVKKSITYFTAPEEDIDNNLNQKNFMRRKPYSYDVKPPQYLLDIQKKGAKTNVPKFMFKDELSKLLFVAVNEQDIGAIKGLLLKGGNINVQNKVNEYTPLMYAVENNKLDSLRYLILRGASLNVVTSNKMSALHLAAITSNLRALRILLSADTDIFLQDKYNKTFFDYVEPNYKNMVISDIFDTRKDASEALIDFCILGSIEGAKFSLQNRANVNSQNHNGDTPLILAVRNNNPQLVTYLLSVGANEAIKNNYKDDAKAVAKKNRYNKILDIMETVKHNKHLHLLGVSENVIPYQLSNEEKERIEKNKKEIADKNFANYSSQGVLGKINEKPKKK